MEEAAEILESRPSSAAAGRRFAVVASITRLAIWILIGLVLAGGAIDGGLRLRDWLWDQTRPIRFHGDIVNAVHWGDQVVARAKSISVDAPADSFRGRYEPLWRAYIGFYDGLVQHRPRGHYALDYAPIRLAVAALWARHIQALPGKRHHPWDDDAIAFMLRINLAMELLAAGAIFGLVFYWVRRERAADQAGLIPAPATERRSLLRWFFGWNWCPWLAASLAALLLWFNPAVLLDAHAWPQWDIVVVAFFLAAALAVSIDACVTAGVLIAVGGMWKGQTLIVAPILALWPLFAGQWRQTLRIGAGFLAGGALLAGPWLIPNLAGWMVVGLWTLDAVILSLFLIKSWRHRTAWVAGVFGAVAFAVAGVMGGSFAWFRIGFIFGAGQFQRMHMGPAPNLPAILQAQWHWSLNDPVTGSWTVGWLLKIIFAIVLLLCAYGAARHARHNSAGVLIALAAPWLAMYALLGQMHERYLMYAAAITAVCVAVSVGMTLLHLLTSVLASIPIYLSLLYQNPKWSPQWRASLDKMLPISTGMVLLLAAIFVYMAVAGIARRGLTPVCQRCPGQDEKSGPPSQTIAPSCR